MMPAPGSHNDTLSRSAIRDLKRILRLKPQSRVLDVGCGQGQLVSQLRRREIDAFGLFDGAPQTRELEEIPAIQPAILHASIPFMAQSFDGVLLRHSDIYLGRLDSPEAYTASANLLACLKPGCSVIAMSGLPLAELQQHLSNFPGDATNLLLGCGGLLGGLVRMLGVSRSQPFPALRFTIPQEPISRKAWHRLALQAVRTIQPGAGVVPQPHMPLGRKSTHRSTHRV